MKHIAVEDLYPAELESLEFDHQILGYTEEEKQFVYNNLFRDENGVAYHRDVGNNKLIAIYID